MTVKSPTRSPEETTQILLIHIRARLFVILTFFSLRIKPGGVTTKMQLLLHDIIYFLLFYKTKREFLGNYYYQDRDQNEVPMASCVHDIN